MNQISFRILQKITKNHVRVYHKVHPRFSKSKSNGFLKLNPKISQLYETLINFVTKTRNQN